MQLPAIGDRAMTRYGYGTVTRYELPMVYVRLDWPFHGLRELMTSYHDIAVPSVNCVLRYSGAQYVQPDRTPGLIGEALFGSAEYCETQALLPTPNRRFALHVSTATRHARLDGEPMAWNEDYVLFRAAAGRGIPWLPIGIATAARLGPFDDWVDRHREVNPVTIEGLVFSCIYDQRTNTVPWYEFHTEAGWISYIILDPTTRRQ